MNIIQLLSARNSATPALVQIYYLYPEGISRKHTKFVLCPVVLKTPLLSKVL